jgi:hypothetical protein
MADVVGDLIAADDSEMLVMSMLRGADLQNALVPEAAPPRTDPTCWPVRSRTSSWTRPRS